MEEKISSRAPSQTAPSPLIPPSSEEGKGIADSRLSVRVEDSVPEEGVEGDLEGRSLLERVEVGSEDGLDVLLQEPKHETR